MITPCHQVYAFFHAEQNRLSFCVDGSDISPDRVELFKTDAGDHVMHVTIGAKKFEITKAGRRELTPTPPEEPTEQVRADIARYFGVEEGCD